MSTIEIIGHRGAAGHEKENTLKSFDRAIEFGVDYIEMDVHLSKDGVAVVFHDHYLDRLTTGKGKILELVLAEIKTSKYKKSESEIPTLTEVLQHLKGRTKFVIEIKDRVAVDVVCEILKAEKVTEETMIIANKPSILQRVKKDIPGIETGLLYYPAKTRKRTIAIVILSKIFFPLTKIFIVKRAQAAAGTKLFLHYPFINSSSVEWFHKKGFKVYVWTVNDMQMIKDVIDSGADGITSDFPDRVKKFTK